MIVILGGASSGKSRMAFEMAQAAGQGAALAGRGPVFVEPMPLAKMPAPVAERAEALRSARQASGSDWVEVTAPFDAEQLQAQCVARRAGVVVFDGLNLWLGHELLAKAGANPGALLEKYIRRETEHLVSSLQQLARGGLRVIVVSASVNEGLPATDELGRLMREHLSLANARLAQNAELVCVMEAGLARVLKAPERWTSGLPLPNGLPEGLWPAFVCGPEVAAKLW